MKGTKFTFFGAMCVLVERSDGKKFLFDPYITENPQTDAPLEQFLDIDYLFVTHNAGDHFGDADVIMENASKAVLFSGKDVNRHVQKRVPLPRERWFGTIYGDSRKLDEITTVHTVNAIHRSKENNSGTEVSHPAFGFIFGGRTWCCVLSCGGHLPIWGYAPISGTVSSDRHDCWNLQL